MDTFPKFKAKYCFINFPYTLHLLTTFTSNIENSTAKCKTSENSAKWFDHKGKATASSLQHIFIYECM